MNSNKIILVLFFFVLPSVSFTQKTTSKIIADRILQEAKILLKQSSWNVSEIAYALGFTEATHFNNFFKKHIRMSPLKFRNN